MEKTKTFKPVKALAAQCVVMRLAGTDIEVAIATPSDESLSEAMAILFPDHKFDESGIQSVTIIEGGDPE